MKKIINWFPEDDPYTKKGEIKLHTDLHKIKYKNKDFTSRKDRIKHIKNAEKIIGNNIEGNVLDIGCGNGRDSLFFESEGLKVISIDNSKSIEFLGNPNNFYKVDIVDIDFKVDIYYARFLIHAIEEEVFDSFLKNLHKLMFEGSKFVFETRSTKNITNLEKQPTNFKSSIGEKHFRMLYSEKYLKSKLEENFKIDYLKELDNVSKYKTDNPCVIRGIISKK